MNLKPLSQLALVALAVILFGGGAQHTAAQPASDALDLGHIAFSTSAETASAQEAFERGVLALHSFWYPQARDHFRKAQQRDSGLAMAYWGEAMTRDHPLWGPLGQHDSTAGRAVLHRLDSLERRGELHWTEREQAYVEALRVLYNGDGDLAARRTAYADTMQRLAQRYPQDDEAAIFSALAQQARPDFDLESAPDVVSVAAPLEAIYQRKPKHPGVLHYLIHVYDSETFAPLGLRMARTYADVAPASSHALHMPSHIFRKLKRWEDVVASNQDAYAASVNWQKRTDRPLRMRDFHAFRWLFEAYLEMEEFDEACQLIEQLQDIQAQAQQRGEDPGRLPDLADRFDDQFQEATADATQPPTCNAAK